MADGTDKVREGGKHVGERGDEEGLLVIVGSRPKKEVGRVGQALCPSRAEACEQRV